MEQQSRSVPGSNQYFSLYYRCLDKSVLNCDLGLTFVSINHKRRELFDAQDAIDSQRDELIARIEKQLQQRHSSQPVFTFRWRLT
jgi:hypothetical protein